MICSRMWAKSINSFFQKDKQKAKQSLISHNMNDEYMCAVRTKSFLKVQLVVNETLSSSRSLHHRRPSELLDPAQETITSLLESWPDEEGDLKSLLVNYFDISAEASKFCSHLLDSLSKVQSDYGYIHDHLISSVDKICPKSDCSAQFASDLLNSCIIADNQFSNLGKQGFNRIHEHHSSVLHHLQSKRKRVARKIKLIKCFNQASGVCITAAAVGLAVAVFVAVHTLAAVLVWPAMIFTIHVKPLKKKFWKISQFQFLKYGFLRKTVSQLDVAAKGAYILNRDFDTMSRLIDRLEDEIEHNRELIRLCVEKREIRVCIEVLKEMKKYELGFMKQVEELEEQIYLCLVTINRARALVVDHICN